MRFTQYFIPTLREDPQDAETISHKLMLRAGMIRKLTQGVYNYLPLGLKTIRKVENIIREEMNRAGAIELLMPAVQPAELWKESGRWDYYGPELLRFKDRHGRDSCLAPTHEEVITDLVRREIRSYRDLPKNFYQIQTKFRDEIRPRFGVMRAREFIMKDAYSFDVDEERAEESYQRMYEAYTRIFDRCNLNFRAVEADTGAIGGAFSHEFMVLADTGEDVVVTCTECSFAANLERAEVVSSGPAVEPRPRSLMPQEVYTPNKGTVEEVTGFLNISPTQLVKTILYKSDLGFIAALVRGDHGVNEAKLKRISGAQQLELADQETVKSLTKAPVGFAGPVGLKDVRIIADNALRHALDVVTGANKEDYHLIHVSIPEDVKVYMWADIRNITKEDKCPRCGKDIEFYKGIEVGHIFKLGTKYSEAMKAYFLDQNGKERPMIMGCYGIGVGRTVAAAIEQNHDEHGILWPRPISPFDVMILPLQMHEPEVKRVAFQLYESLMKMGMDVLIDDRDERAGVKFNDADLIGVPIRISVGMKSLKEGYVEIRERKNKEQVKVEVSRVPQYLKEI